MAGLARFQLDMTPEELSAVERWSSLAGFRTKKELLLNAFTLFKWAAQQVMLGRTICAINEATGEVRHLEMPALAAIADCAGPSPLTPEEIRRRLAQPSRPLSEVLAALQGERDAEPVGASEPRR